MVIKSCKNHAKCYILCTNLIDITMEKDTQKNQNPKQEGTKKPAGVKTAKTKESKEPKVAAVEEGGSIHTEYFPDAVITCACGNKIKVGSVKKEINVEICSKCHPFYTGQEKILDSAGRVEKFKAKRIAATKIKDKKTAAK